MWIEFLLNCAAAYVFFLIMIGGTYYVAYKNGVFDNPNVKEDKSSGTPGH